MSDKLEDLKSLSAKSKGAGARAKKAQLRPSLKKMLIAESYDSQHTVGAFLKLGSFHQRRERLEKTRVALKAKFVGIDSQIDHTIDALTFWYMYPEKVDRPVVVCLWGMTGTGKTALVRDISLLLGMHSAYTEVVLNDETSKRDDAFVHKVINGGSAEGHQSIVLLDEFQRFSTLDEQGRTKREMGYTSVWQVLSDGKYMGSVDKWDVDNDLEEFVSNVSKPGTKIIKTSSGIMIGDTMIRTLFYEKCLNDLGVPTVGMTVVDLLGKLIELFGVMSTGSLTYTMDFSKTAFFVVGNLDDAFHDKFMSTSDYVSPDEYHSWAQAVDLYAIKKSLRKRFLPEQVARLGNVHVVYPVLSSDDYREVIRREVTKLFHDMSGGAVTFDDTFVELILRNGVFPTQGVRPVFTTCRQMVELVCTKLLSMDFTHKCQVSYSYTPGTADTARLVASFEGRSDLSLHHIGDKDKFLYSLDLNHDFVRIVCVHEAGHALAYRILFGEFPECVLLQPSGGQTVMRSARIGATVNAQMGGGIMSLSGMLAEELVIGSGHYSIGSGSDIKSATSSAAQLVRSLGVVMSEGSFSKALSDGLLSDRAVYSCVPPGSDSDDLNSCVVADRNEDIKNFMAFFFSSARELLKPHKQALVDLSEMLLENKYIHKSEFQDRPEYGSGMINGLLNPFVG